ncbi:hypothetical protein AB0M92_26205 [Streptomyces sp. NPDC051582]|uniref:hypothetical protein n=1 Tax=Streptomyces sp. NPDC051582 TaxID=3155167 RepID=UPI003448BAA1
MRRLTELGLGLDEVRDVLADDAGRELADVLEELDADLARQEAAIRERRRRLAALRAAPPGEGFKETLLAEFTPAQAEVVRRVMEAFTEGGRG